MTCMRCLNYKSEFLNPFVNRVQVFAFRSQLLLKSRFLSLARWLRYIFTNQLLPHGGRHGRRNKLFLYVRGGRGTERSES